MRARAALAIVVAAAGCGRGCGSSPPARRADLTASERAPQPPQRRPDAGALAEAISDILAKAGPDWNADQSVRWLAELIRYGDLPAAGAFARRAGPWTKAVGLAQLAAAHAARGETAAAQALLEEAYAARVGVQMIRPSVPPKDGTDDVLQSDGGLALAIHVWHAEKRLGLRHADLTWSEIVGAEQMSAFSPHIFRAWLEAGEIERAADVAARPQAGRIGLAREVADIARVVDAARLNAILARLPPVADSSSQTQLEEILRASIEGATARGDHATVTAAIFGHLAAMPRIHDPVAYLASIAIAGDLRRGDLGHAGELVERWRRQPRTRPDPDAPAWTRTELDLYAAMGRTRGAAAAEALMREEGAAVSLPAATAAWLVRATEPQLASVPPLGLLLGDERAFDLIVTELCAISRRGAPGCYETSDATRAKVLARVVERRAGRHGQPGRGWSDLEIDAAASSNRLDALAAVGRGAAEAGDLDVAERLLARVIAEDGRGDAESRPVRSHDVARLAAAYAERGDIDGVVRALHLDHDIVGVTPNTVDVALAALPAASGGL